MKLFKSSSFNKIYHLTVKSYKLNAVRMIIFCSYSYDFPIKNPCKFMTYLFLWQIHVRNHKPIALDYITVILIDGLETR